MALDEKTILELRTPFGPVMESLAAMQRIWARRPQLLIAVGDETLFRLLENGIKPDIGVFDLRCRRASIGEMKERLILNAAGNAIVARNPPGAITPELRAAVDESLLEGGRWIRIDGEDDLAALVFFARAPDGAVVLYGQPNMGLVFAEVDDEIRGRALELMLKIRE